MTDPLVAAGGSLGELPAVVRTWVDGWARSRGTDAPRDVPGGFRIEVGSPNHRARYVLPAADPAVLRDLVGAIDTPGLWIKVCAPREALEPALTPAWKISEPQYLMVSALAPMPPATPPPGYTLDLTDHDGIIDARVLCSGSGTGTGTGTGSDSGGAVLAASGRAALTTGAPGSVAYAVPAPPYPAAAVFDMIGTEAAHRRRGLGRFLMATLARRAAELGAGQGVLVASPDGRALYEALGWRLRAPVTAAVFTA
ncbi:GNAT family N-acetyltransferase [Streptomyces celluloflavus]|uniref:GNAT family N-acetyltransferase n=1 Tax=Streptomyces celluloflavus TaxID=58344 RepID=A0ABW7RC42_9ACTN